MPIQGRFRVVYRLGMNMRSTLATLAWVTSTRHSVLVPIHFYM